MASAGPVLPQVDRGQLVASLDAFQKERGLDDDRLCALLMQQNSRMPRRMVGPTRYKLDCPTLHALRSGALLSGERLNYIAAALACASGKEVRPEAAEAIDAGPSWRERLTALHLGRVTGVLVAVGLLALYLFSDETYQAKFQGIATIGAALPIVIACFIYLFKSGRIGPDQPS